MHRPIQSSKTMAIDINDLTGTSKVRTASWEKEAFDRWEKYGVDENGVPQKIQHRVKRFLLSYGTGWEAFLEGGEALELVDEYQRNEYGFYYDYSAEYIPELKGTQAEYVKRVLDGLKDKAKEECINNLMGKPSGFIEANDENTDLSQHMSYRVEQDDGVGYVVYTSENELNSLRLEVARAEEKIQEQQARITELEALTASTTASPEGQPTDEDKEGGTGRYGLLKLSCTQCIDAFALLLSEATGLELMDDGEIPSIRTPRGKAVAELYSVVSGKSVDTCKSYIRQRKTPEKDTLRGEKMKEVQETITKLLRELKRE